MNKLKDIIIVILLVVLVYILNTEYTITIDNTSYSQKIIYYMLGVD